MLVSQLCHTQTLRAPLGNRKIILVLAHRAANIIGPPRLTIWKSRM